MLKTSPDVQQVQSFWLKSDEKSVKSFLCCRNLIYICDLLSRTMPASPNESVLSVLNVQVIKKCFFDTVRMKRKAEAAQNKKQLPK